MFNLPFLGEYMDLLLIGWSVVFVFLVAFDKGNTAYIKCLLVFVLLLSFYGLLLILSDKVLYVSISGRYVPNKSYLRNLIRSLGPIFVVYYYAKRNGFSLAKLKLIYYIFLILTLIRVFVLNSSDGADDVINRNFAFAFIPFMPFTIIVIKKQYVKDVLIALFVFISIVLMKRGVILSLFVAFLIYLFRTRLQSSSVGNKIVTVLFSLGLLLGLYSLVSNLYTTNDFFQARFENTMEGDSSGRDDLFSFFYNYYLQRTTVSEFLFGMGANATLAIWWNYAHNDWLEIAINQGLIGLFVYLSYWVSFVVLALKKNSNRDVKTALMMFASIYFILTFVSMSYGSYGFLTAIPLGYCVAEAQKCSAKVK